jgi:hypothetical protein
MRIQGWTVYTEKRNRIKRGKRESWMNGRLKYERKSLSSSRT